MDDNFYHPASNASSPPPGLLASVSLPFAAYPVATAVTLLSLPVFIVLATRLLSGRASVQADGGKARSVWMPPYWVPVFGHVYFMIREPLEFMSRLRDQSHHGIFALNLGATTHNVISDPKLVSSAMAQRESALAFIPIAKTFFIKLFGVPANSWVKYQVNYEELAKLYSTHLMREPGLGKILSALMKQLEHSIPQMISFSDTDIDLHRWERYAGATYISDTETELNLMALTRDMMGNASTSAVFGSAILEKYPDVLHDVYDFDNGMYYFLAGIPSWFPWPASMKAHMARARVWAAIDDQQRALDARAEGKPFDATWEDLDDVSDFILARNEIFRNNGYTIKERGDTSIIWALAINANMLVYWLIFYIISTPDLLPRIRAEIAPYVQIHKPVSINSISEVPKMSISYEGLATKCPLLKSCYLEALRLADAPWSVRQVATTTTLTAGKSDPDAPAFKLNKGDFVTVPHDLHMRDPHFFPNPNKFIPDRFIVPSSSPQTVDAQTIRPYGGGPSMCKGRLFAEKECFSLVAGVLAYWDFEPADRVKGYVIPKMQKTSAVARPHWRYEG